MEDKGNDEATLIKAGDMNRHDTIVAVVIGRNEGERLVRCLESVLCQIGFAAYVDSGSTDGSIAFARSLGIEVLSLDTSVPFSAGRARNAGAARILALHPNCEYVQFVDGDCELHADWAARAVKFLETHPEYAIVAGRLREREPGKSIYNELCDIEWARPSGPALSCGGIFAIRAAAFSAVDGFNTSMIAGEEPELCFRLRERGWKIFCLDNPMAVHDANITRFAQWWKRTVRSGYAYAHRYSLHVKNNDAYLRRAQSRIWVWSAAVPIFIATACAIISPWFLLCLVAYAIQLFHGYTAAYSTTSRKGPSLRYAFFNVIGKWPQLVGQIKFLWERAQGKKAEIIEYKK